MICFNLADCFLFLIKLLSESGYLTFLRGELRSGLLNQQLADRKLALEIADAQLQILLNFVMHFVALLALALQIPQLLAFAIKALFLLGQLTLQLPCVLLDTLQSLLCYRLLRKNLRKLTFFLCD
jgi:hypothetical protein